MSAKKLSVRGCSVEMALLILTIYICGICIFTMTNTKIQLPFNILPISRQFFGVLMVIGGIIGTVVFTRMAFKPMAILKDNEIDVYFRWKFKWKKFSWDQIKAIKSRVLPSFGSSFGAYTTLSFKNESKVLKIFTEIGRASC